MQVTNSATIVDYFPEAFIAEGHDDIKGMIVTIKRFIKRVTFPRYWSEILQHYCCNRCQNMIGNRSYQQRCNSYWTSTPTKCPL